MERVENETKSRLNHQVEVAEKELINIKRKLENAETEHKNTIQRLEVRTITQIIPIFFLIFSLICCPTQTYFFQNPSLNLVDLHYKISRMNYTKL